MASGGLVKIAIPNWGKYNPRADRANYTWFRLQNDFFTDQAVFELSNEEKLLALFVLCEASKKNCGEILLSLSYVQALLKLDLENIIEGLERLNRLGILNAVIEPASRRHNAVTEPASLPATNVRTYETNVRTKKKKVLDQDEGQDDAKALDSAKAASSSSSGNSNPERRAAKPAEANEPDWEPDKDPLCKTGPIPEFCGIVGSELLLGVSHRGQKVWLKTFGIELIREQLPLAYSGWESDPVRSQLGAVQVFLRHWFQNAHEAAKARGSPARADPKLATPALSVPDAEKTRAYTESFEKIQIASLDSVRDAVRRIVKN